MPRATKSGNTNVSTKDVLSNSSWFFSETGQQAWVSREHWLDLSRGVYGLSGPCLWPSQCAPGR